MRMREEFDKLRFKLVPSVLLEAVPVLAKGRVGCPLIFGPAPKMPDELEKHIRSQVEEQQ